MGGRGSGGGRGGGGGGAAKKAPSGEGIISKNELINMYNSISGNPAYTIEQRIKMMHDIQDKINSIEQSIKNSDIYKKADKIKFTKSDLKDISVNKLQELGTQLYNRQVELQNQVNDAKRKIGYKSANISNSKISGSKSKLIELERNSEILKNNRIEVEKTIQKRQNSKKKGN